VPLVLSYESERPPDLAWLSQFSLADASFWGNWGDSATRLSALLMPALID
jgi:hypothetical protein